MDAKQFWQLFLETGAPEVYMMYARARKSEGDYVSEYLSPGFEDQQLQ